MSSETAPLKTEDDAESAAPQDEGTSSSPSSMMDITDVIRQCAGSLTYAEPVLHREDFSLQDAMGATQLSDRKMDGCEVAADLIAPWRPKANDDDTLFPRPSPQSLDDPFCPLPWENLTVSDAAWISLEILVRQVALLRGASLGESTLTCLYAHNAVLADMRERLFAQSREESAAIQESESLSQPSPTSQVNGTLPQRVVYATTLALVETTDVIRSVILNADIYEEEDFVAQTHGATLFTELVAEEGDSQKEHEVDTVQQLSDAKDLLSQQDETTEGNIILLVMGVQLGLLFSCTRLAKLTPSELTETTQAMQAIGSKAVQKLEQLREIVPDEYSEEIRSLLWRSFDSFVNRPTVGNAPVRKVSFQTPKEAIASLTQVFIELDTSLCTLLTHGSSLNRIRRILEQVAKSDVNILVRSLMVLNLYFDNRLLGRHVMPDLMEQDLRQKTRISEQVLVHEQARAFLHRLAKPLYDTLKLQTLNPQRQRAYLEAVLLQEWTQLQNEAQMLDMHLRRELSLDPVSTPPHFSHYVLGVLMRLMDRFVALSLELGLCDGHDDISFAVWYRDFLLSAILKTTMAHRQAAAAAAATTSKSTPTKKGKGKKRHSGKNGKNSNKASPNVVPDKEEELTEAVLDLQRDLCRGTVRFIAALRQAEILKSPTFEFTSLESIFDKRFELFDMIQQPPPLSYADYLEGSSFANVTPDDLWRTTVDIFASCKALAEHLHKEVTLLIQQDESFIYDTPMRPDELRSLVKVCVGNSVYLLKLRQRLGERKANVDDKPIQVDFDWTAHPQFCTIKLS